MIWPSIASHRSRHYLQGIYQNILVGFGKGLYSRTRRIHKKPKPKKDMPTPKKNYEDDADDDAVSMYSPCVMSTRKNMRGYIIYTRKRIEVEGEVSDVGMGVTWGFIT